MIITTLLSLNAKMCKTYIDDDKNPSPYDLAKKFDISTHEVSSIQEFYKLLKVLENVHNMCIIRGVARNGGLLKNVARRENQERWGDNITIIDQPIDWLCIDLDDDKLVNILPKDIKQDEIPEWLLYMVLPKEFHDVDYVFQFSSSAGLSHWLKGHFWFKTSNDFTSTQLRDWHKSLPKSLADQIDTATFKSAQPHYTAIPQFNGTVTDPVKQRTMLKIKNNRAVDIIIPDEVQLQQINEDKKIIMQERSNTQANGYNNWLVILDGVTTNSATPACFSAMSSYHKLFGINADWEFFIKIYLDQLIRVGHRKGTLIQATTDVKDKMKDVTNNVSFNKKMTSCNEYVIYKIIGEN